jgi:dipeptidyl aminopeptidase/acylaminoacyl peptidase
MSTKSKAKSKPDSEQSPAKRLITAEDLLELRIVSDPRISPDGRVILFTLKQAGEKPCEYATNLGLVEVAGGATRQFTAGGKDRHGRWSPDGEWIAFIAERQKHRPQIHLMPAAGGEALVLTRFPEGSLREFKWSPDGRSLAVAFRATDPEWTDEAKKKRDEAGHSIPPRVVEEMYYRFDGDGYFNGDRYYLYLVDATSGTARMVFDKDTTGEFSFDWSRDSQQLAIAANPSRNAILKPWKTELFLLDATTGKSHKIPNVPVGTKESIAWSGDGKWLAFAGREGKQPVWGVANQQLFVCDPHTGKTVNLTAGEDYCLGAAILSDSREASFESTVRWSPDSRRIFLNIGWQGENHVASVPVAGGPITFHTHGAQAVGLGNFNRDGTRLALTVGHQLAPSEIALGELRDSAEAPGSSVLSMTPLTNVNGPLLLELELAPAEMHWLDSTDGAKVQMWVLKPPGFKEGRKYPAVLQIHGGPHTQYGTVFFHEFQLLAAAGYVVCYSNPRGSKGYGEAHCTAIRGKWGKADWEDIQAVTAWMRAQPFIAAKRMGVMGGSYGGYMTNWVIGHSTDFAAAITDRCVSNLVSMVGSSDIPLVPGHYWEGNSWDKIDELWAQSPLKYFGNVNVPTLIIHSEGDLRCNVEQAEQVFAALKLRDIPTRFVRYPASTSHGLSRGGPPDLRLHRLREILAWWERHLA